MLGWIAIILFVDAAAARIFVKDTYEGIYVILKPVTWLIWPTTGHAHIVDICQNMHEKYSHPVHSFVILRKYYKFHLILPYTVAMSNIFQEILKLKMTQMTKRINWKKVSVHI